MIPLGVDTFSVQLERGSGSLSYQHMISSSKSSITRLLWLIDEICLPGSGIYSWCSGCFAGSFCLASQRGDVQEVIPESGEGGGEGKDPIFGVFFFFFWI